MLHAFVSSRAVRSHHEGVGGLSASVVAHAGVVVLAVIATTAPPLPDRDARSPGVEQVVFFTRVASDEDGRERAERPTAAPARRVPRGAVASRPDARRGARATSFEHADFSTIDAELAALVDAVHLDASHLGEIDFAGLASDDIEFARDGLREFSAVPRAVARLANGAYAERDVEKTVASTGSNPRPYYPPRLQHDNVEATFLVRFVVDSTGRVNRGTFEFPPTTHRLFVKSVRDALLRSRFIPAELGGRRVPQMVQQRFSFVMTRH